MRMAVVLLASLPFVGNAGAAVPQDGGYAIFDPSQSKALLRQCSRGSPEAGEAGWTPSDGDIARLEAGLPAALASAGVSNRRELAGAPAHWFRQYVGIVRGGRRFIYGNFAPSYGGALESPWRTQPLIVCDGGVGFFGAEYDLEKGMFTHLAFNGYA